ncbi:MAG: hypothetical protein LBF72_03620 [Holosporales bacterium]|nr:hypothetical protein [Holosporales bacterium]
MVRNFPGLYKKITEYSPHATEFVIAVGTIVSVIAVVAVCKMLTSSGPVASNPGTATKNPLSPSGGESHLSSVGAGQALDGNAGGSLPVVSTENQFGGYVEQPVEGAKIREENQSFGSSSEVDIQPEVTTPISPVQSSSPITPTPTPALVQTPTPVSTPPAPVPTRTPTPTPTPTPQTPTPTPAPRPGLRLAHAEPTPTPGPVDSFRDYSNSIQVMELYYKRLNKEV